MKQVLLDKLGRVLVPLLTPFDSQDQVNTKALADLIDFIIENDYGDSLIATGSTGEFPARCLATRDRNLRTRALGHQSQTSVQQHQEVTCS